MLKIDDNKIIGVIGPDRNNIINQLYKDKKIKKIYLFDEDIVKDVLKCDKLDEVIKMVDLKKDILCKKIENLSESEIIKVKFAYYLILNSKYIIIDDFIDILDNKNKDKFCKIILKLKKYYNKTIIISTSNIDNIFEVIDKILYCSDEIIYDDKFEIYKNNNLEEIPEIIRFVSIVKEKYNVEYKDSINELIKELYRELR